MMAIKVFKKTNKCTLKIFLLLVAISPFSSLDRAN